MDDRLAALNSFWQAFYKQASGATYKRTGRNPVDVAIHFVGPASHDEKTKNETHVISGSADMEPTGDATDAAEATYSPTENFRGNFLGN